MIPIEYTAEKFSAVRAHYAGIERAARLFKDDPIRRDSIRRLMVEDREVDLVWLEILKMFLRNSYSHRTSCYSEDEYAGKHPTYGHCAVVAMILHALFGGCLMSCTIELPDRTQVSHWYNYLRIAGKDERLDLTLDQFEHLSEEERATVGSEAGTDHRVRELSHVREETFERALLLARPSAVPLAHQRLEIWKGCLFGPDTAFPGHSVLP